MSELKASDLRVGNIAYHPNRGKDGYTYINSRDIQNIEEGTEFGKLFQPVPITPEWLIKLGFEKVKDVNENSYPDWIIKGMLLHTNVHGFYVLGNHTPMVCFYHVHEVQNAYKSLTLTELKQGKK